MSEPRLIKNTYRLEHRIGSGGMASVYAAVHVDLGRACAIKQLKEQFSDRPDILRRFRREARDMADLIHPNIVHVFDYGVEEGFGAYLVMDLIAGTDLGQVIRERGALPFAEVARIGSQVAAALELAHQRGLVHRDIKPGNILIEQSTGRALVADFGIAKHLEPGEDETATQTEGFIGTSRYASPEQLRGEDLDARGDLYALGAVLYEMASGKRFLEGLRDTEIVLQVLGNPLNWPPVDYGTPVPEGFVRLVEDCLQRQREQRIGSARAVIERLEQCRDQALVLPPPRLLAAMPASSTTILPEGPTQATQFAGQAKVGRRSRGRAIAALSALAAAAIAVLVWTRSEAPLPPTQKLAPTPQVAATVIAPAVEAVQPVPPVAEVKPTVAPTLRAAPVAPLTLATDPARLTTLSFGKAQHFKLTPPAGVRESDLHYDWQLAGQRVAQTAQYTFANTDADMVRGQPVQLTVVASDDANRSFHYTWEFKVVPPAPRIAEVKPPAGDLQGEAGKPLTLALSAAPVVGNQSLTYIFNADGKDSRSSQPTFELTPSGADDQVVVARVTDNYGQESAPTKWTIRGLNLEEQARRWLEEYRSAFNEKDADKLGRMLHLAPEKLESLRKQLELQRDLRVAFNQVEVEKLADGRVRATYERHDSFRNPSTGAAVEPPPVRVEQVFSSAGGKVQLER